MKRKANILTQAEWLALDWLSYADNAISKGDNPDKLSNHPNEWFAKYIENGMGSRVSLA